MAKNIQISEASIMQKVFSIMRKTAVTENLTALARELGASTEEVSTLGSRLRLETRSKQDTLYNILTGWVSRKATEATLQSLIEALEELELNDCRQKLESEFLGESSLANNPAGTAPSLTSESDRPIDVFISYRRSTGSQLASLLKEKLQQRGFNVFVDVDGLLAGRFDESLLQKIREAPHFVLLLSANALDRCIGDEDCNDWVHKEIAAALEAKRNIIPVTCNFVWPKEEGFPEKIKTIFNLNAVMWVHDYQDACVDKIQRFIRQPTPL